MLHLTTSFDTIPCPECNGKGTIPCPVTIMNRDPGPDGVPFAAPGHGFPIPCPTCKGKKIILKENN